MGLYDDPNMAALAAMAAAFGQGAMPSRMKVPFGAIAGQAAGAGFKGAKDAQEYQKLQTENMMNQLNLGYTQQMMPYRIGALRDAYNDAGGNMPMGIPNTGSPNNNPGNMRPVGASTGFQSFATPEAGADAMAKDLNLKISGLSPAMKGQTPTLSNVISTWAPPTENDTDSYVKFVSNETGIKPDQVLTPQHIPALQAAMTKFEGNAANKSSPQSQSKLSPQVQAQVTQLRRDKVLAPPEKWGDIDAKIAEILQTDPAIVQEKTEATKGGENSSEIRKTLNVVTSNLPTALKRFQELRDVAKDTSYGLGVEGKDNEPGWKQTLAYQLAPHNDSMKKTANANTTFLQKTAQGVLPELGPSLAQAGIKGNKFLETLANEASGLSLTADPESKMKAIQGLEDQYIRNMKSTAAQARAYGDKNAPTEAEIDSIVKELKAQHANEIKPASGAPNVGVTHIYKPGQGIVPAGGQ